MSLIYCATPSRFAERTEEIMDYVTQQGLGPFHPFKAFDLKRFEYGPIGRDKTMDYCVRAVKMCDEFWMFGISRGTLIELEAATSLTPAKPVRFLYEKFDPEWSHYRNLLTDEFPKAMDLLPRSTSPTGIQLLGKPSAG